MPHDGPTELFVVSASDPRLVCAIIYEIVHIKESLLLKSNPCSVNIGILSDSSSGSLADVRRHITVDKIC